jgi:polyphosphate kinase
MTENPDILLAESDNGQTVVDKPVVDKPVVEPEEVATAVAKPAPATFQHPIPLAVAPQPVPEGADLKHPSLYFNMELGWIDFNWRVLHLALDERTPLLERVRFIAITASNLDEFIQKRVGGLKRQKAAGVTKLSPDGRTPEEQLDLVNKSLLLMHRAMTITWEKILKPLLQKEANIIICTYDSLTETEKEALYTHFKQEIYPILTPLTVDPGHPFPFLSNLSLSLAVILRHPGSDKTQFARLKLPANRWLLINNNGSTNGQPLRYLPVEELIIQHIGELFPGMEITSVHPFRITRNADVDRDEEVASDLLSMISSELRERKFAPVVRLEVAESMPEFDRSLLMQELEIPEEDVWEVDGLLNLIDCFRIADIDLPEFRFKPWKAVVPGQLRNKGKIKHKIDIFNVIRQGDLLVHHPYESFGASVQKLVEDAAVDPNVLAIKQTLYRTSDESPIIQALIQAAENGKQVAVLVEVKARFDEANNIEWAQKLGDVGVHVAYGLVGLKTHTKATLIVRQEEDGVKTYCHIGTGNYNPKTARLYTDIGLFTCNPVLGRDVVNLFHFLTGYAPDQEYEKVLVAPRNMRKSFYELIEQEMVHQAELGNGRIIAKMNAIDDQNMIRKLYEASQAGVQIDLIIRGHSRLRPGLPGYSENIRVVSILGRFLEHDRIFYFHNNDQPQIFIGSADWRNRNLKERVELITPIEEPALQARLIEYLELALKDNRLAWDLHSDGRYTLRYPAEGEKVRNFHQTLMKQSKKRAKKKRK